MRPGASIHRSETGSHVGWGNYLLCFRAPFTHDICDEINRAAGGDPSTGHATSGAARRARELVESIQVVHGQRNADTSWRNNTVTDSGEENGELMSSGDTEMKRMVG